MKLLAALIMFAFVAPIVVLLSPLLVPLWLLTWAHKELEGKVREPDLLVGALILLPFAIGVIYYLYKLAQ